MKTTKLPSPPIGLSVFLHKRVYCVGSLQEIDNGVGGGSTFDLTTGIAVGNTGNNSTVGFNSSTLATLAPDTSSIKTTFVVSSANAGNVSANGFFFGLVTGTSATDPGGPGLFNNLPAAVGILLDNSNGAATDNLLFISDPDGGAPTLTETILATGFPTVASLNDGFTLDFTIFDDDTFLVTTSGLSNDVTGATGTLPTTAGLATFDTFLTGGVGVNGTIQTGTAGGGFTIESVTVHAEVAVPEPSSFALLGMVTLGLVTRRRR